MIDSIKLENDKKPFSTLPVEHARLLKALEEAQDAEATGRVELSQSAGAIRKAQSKLTELADAESVLRKRLSGEL